MSAIQTNPSASQLHSETQSSDLALTEHQMPRRQFITAALASCLLATPSKSEPVERDFDFLTPSGIHLEIDKMRVDLSEQEIRDHLKTLTTGDEVVEHYSRAVRHNTTSNAIDWAYANARGDILAFDKLLVKELGKNHDDIHVAATYDTSWMPGTWCDAYTWYLLRKEQGPVPWHTVDPQELLATGYLPVKNPQDYDVVVYLDYCQPSSRNGVGEWRWTVAHYGMYLDDKVISKNNSHNIYRHRVDAVGSMFQTVLYLRKFGDQDPTDKPYFPVNKISDWQEVDGVVTRISRPASHEPKASGKYLVAGAAVTGLLYAALKLRTRWGAKPPQGSVTAKAPIET